MTSLHAQCIAQTLAGHRCTREAEQGSDYCWQHQKYEQSLESAESTESVGQRFSELKVGKTNASNVSPYLRTDLMQNYTKKWVSGNMPKQTALSPVAHGPLHLQVSAKNYVNFPGVTLELKNKGYSFIELYEDIKDLLLSSFTEDYFQRLASDEHSRIQSGPRSTSEKAEVGLATYEGVYLAFDPENVDNFMKEITYTGPNSVTGTYYIRVPYQAL
jgi:hypothetical protein